MRGRGLEACWGISGLTGPSQGVWARDGRRLNNSDKEFALTMEADAESLKAGAGDGQGCRGRREGEKQAPGNIPK